MPRNLTKSLRESHEEHEAQIMALMGALRTDLEKNARALLAGRITSTQAVQLAQAAFNIRHQQAASIGSHLASVQAGVSPLQQFPASIGGRVAQSQNAFFRSLRTDLIAGRYDDPTGAGLKARLQLYANRLIGTANEAWADGMQKAGSLVLWVLGKNENHCLSCVYESKQGWRNPGLMTRFPGDGGTECLVNCWCGLRTKEGYRGFSRGMMIK